jgi:hypothetical protein
VEINKKKVHEQKKMEEGSGKQNKIVTSRKYGMNFIEDSYVRNREMRRHTARKGKHKSNF